MSLLALIFLSTVYSSLAGIIGLDISQPVSTSTAQCFVEAGYRYVIPRVLKCNGQPDNGAIASYRALKAANMPHIGFYLFPCGGVNCPTAQQQIQSAQQFLSRNSMVADSIWLDIESASSCPWGTASANQAFYKQLVDAAIAAFGKGKVGIYSNTRHWNTIFGSSTWQNPGDQDLPVWFARYDYEPNYTNWADFGPWTLQSTIVKQYVGDISVCGHNVDINYAKTFFDVAESPESLGTPHVACSFNSKAGVCQKTTTCTDGTAVPSSQGADGCQKLPAAWTCCVGDSAAAPEPSCTFNGATGTCVKANVCSARGETAHTPSSQGASGCENEPVDVKCCTPQSSEPSCSFNGQAGTCVSSAICGSRMGHTHTPSSGGATGCQAFAADIKCCTPPDNDLPSCAFQGTTGTCIAEAQCLAQGEYAHTPSSQGATGCESFSTSIKCCTQKKAQCEYLGVAGECVSDCQSGFAHTASASGATGCERFPQNVKCCTPNGGQAEPTCQFSGKSGSCVDSATCSARGESSHTPASGGATGCESLPASIKCCTPNDNSNPTPSACTFADASGTCVDEMTCKSFGEYSHTAASAGASGCERFAGPIKCCTPDSNNADPDCTANGKQGVCLTSEKCTARGANEHVASADGANGCQAFPADVRCCIDAVNATTRPTAVTTSSQGNATAPLPWQSDATTTGGGNAVVTEPSVATQSTFTTLLVAVCFVAVV